MPFNNTVDWGRHKKHLINVHVSMVAHCNRDSYHPDLDAIEISVSGTMEPQLLRFRLVLTCFIHSSFCLTCRAYVMVTPASPVDNESFSNVEKTATQTTINDPMHSMIIPSHLHGKQEAEQFRLHLFHQQSNSAASYCLSHWQEELICWR